MFRCLTSQLLLYLIQLLKVDRNYTLVNWIKKLNLILIVKIIKNNYVGNLDEMYLADV